MQRRTFMTAALATAVLSLAGCAAQTRADTDMPAEAFTPEGARRYLAKCRTAREAILAELRALNADELQSLKVPVASGEVLEEYNAYYARQ